MDLNLSIARTVGRAAKPNQAEIIRPLGEADIAVLGTERGIKPNHVQKLKDSHHAVARCIAEGMRAEEISVITGYTPNRISILQVDPAFQELIEFYRKHKDIGLADLRARMSNLSLDMLQELHERLQDNPEEISSSMLLDGVKTFADRTGHGPQSRVVNTNINVNLAERVASGRQRAGLTSGAPRPLPAPGDSTILAPVLDLEVVK